jgi:type I restriction enzyme R subunit
VILDSPNFSFLAAHDRQLAQLGALAERNFKDDPNTCLFKLRLFGELLAQQVAARTGYFKSAEEVQSDLLRRLKAEHAVSQEALDLFHQLRVLGNSAVHEHAGDHRDALANLKIARQLGIWFHRTFGKQPAFKPGPFVPPPDPEAASTLLKEELNQLRADLAQSQTATELAQRQAEEHARARESAEAKAIREASERTVWEQLAHEIEQEKNAVAARLHTLQQTSAATPSRTISQLIEQGQEVAKSIDLDEAATRAIIDQKLRDRGWEVDSTNLRYSKGTRPVKGRAMAIAEWPTESGPADYAFFIGLQCVAVAEAKRKRTNVSAAIDQAERYSKGIKLGDGTETAGGSWGEYLVPFVFSTNGRPYLKQLETSSGIWFRDTRHATNHRRALVDWFTPEGLKAELGMDRVAATEALTTQTYDFGFPLRPYQKKAIQKVEEALGRDERAMLVAMATGTGKTKLAIALLYRLLTAKRFRRICFVVDRNALGQQTGGEFSTTKIIGPRTFAEIFDLKGIDDTTPETETKVHICTIQGLVRRVLYAENPADMPPIDQYDLMVIDECHRGYLLDREMSDMELSFRSEEDYISKYRRVLEYFDAVKIGLTATPALHTVEIFGKPIYTYSYREAVIDGFLIDHEPPIRITTALSQAGIIFHSGEEVEVLDTRSGQIDLIQAPDELRFDVEAFNRKVITEKFNRVVADELAQHIDPALPGKTLIFATTDAHADMVVKEMKRALREAYGEIEDAAVRKVTGSVDRVSQLIRSYRNDDLPKIAVTVDLLTTGIDVPSITNLVFLRRVNSRILYEQMLGRATRQCPGIGKETFRIFDAVDIYAKLQQVTEMKPIVVDPTITLEQLFEELSRVQEERQQETICDQIIVKMRRLLKHMGEEAREQYEATAGETPEATLDRFQTASAADSAAWARSRLGIGAILDWTSNGSTPSALPISHHADEVIAVTRGYGEAARPEDFLDGFTNFIRSNINQIAALNLVVQRPRELTREQLRTLRLELDRLGYSETNLRRAWQDAKNEEIAASIIGFIRQAALGEALKPYDQRVRDATRRILMKHSWSDPQRRWLQRISEQIEKETLVDRESLDREPFAGEGGFTRLNKVFKGQLEEILKDFNEELWRKAA